MFLRFVCLILILSCNAHATYETLGGDEITLQDLEGETLFISLGSYCAPAALTRSCGLRKAAFPFDWNMSFDGEYLIKALEEDFENFLKEEYLVPDGPDTLLNTYYHMEFIHDGRFWDELYSYYLPLLQAKYKRRIARFKSLKDFRGKVWFLRSAYLFSVDGKSYYHVPENIEITEDFALRLFKALKDMFPGLDFSLLITNNHEQESVLLEKWLTDRILMIRGPALNKDQISPLYCSFYLSELVDKFR